MSGSPLSPPLKVTFTVHKINKALDACIYNGDNIFFNCHYCGNATGHELVTHDDILTHMEEYHQGRSPIYWICSAISDVNIRTENFEYFISVAEDYI